MNKTEIKIGDEIVSDDPRARDRKMVVRRIGPSHLYARVIFIAGLPGICEYRILKSRVHSDGKIRKWGFSLLTDQTKPTEESN